MSDHDAAANGYGSQANSEQEATAKFDREELVRGWREYEARQPHVVPVLKYDRQDRHGPGARE